MVNEEIERLLNEYAANSRAFAESVERLRHVTVNTEAFISALAEAGAAHRVCERSRIAVDRHLSQRWRPAVAGK